MWESRVLQRAFERLELHEGKLSRAVLRGGGGGDVTSLPDARVGNHPGLPGSRSTRLVLPRITLGPQRREDGLCRGAIPAVALWPRHGRQPRKTVSSHRDVASVTWAGRGCQQVQAETEVGDDLCRASGPERGEGNCPIRVLPATLRSPGRRIGQRGDATRAPSQGPRPGWAAGRRPSAFPGLAGKR